MSLNEYSDRELRKWCVEKVLAHWCEFDKSVTDTAEELFQYIKFGPDDGYDCCDDPDDGGPVNMGPGMDVLRACASIETAEPPDHIHPE